MYAIPFLTLLVLAALIYILQPSIKKYASLFYLGALIVSVISIVYMISLGHPKDVNIWQKIYIHTFGVGVVGNSLFILIMYIGALSNNNAFRKRLMPIRGELSIIATIFVLIHNIVFGKRFFVMLFTNPLKMHPIVILASILSLLAIIIMLPLFITSFKCVRAKMDTKKWIKLQRWAYVFYYLVFAHIVVIKIISISKRISMNRDLKEPIITLCFYVIVYVSYTILKVRKDKFNIGK